MCIYTGVCIHRLCVCVWSMRVRVRVCMLLNVCGAFALCYKRLLRTLQRNCRKTGNVQDMSRLFDGATAFNKPINGWDTHSVTKMDQMFSGATSFDHPLNRLDVSSVTSMYFMFSNAKVSTPSGCFTSQ